MSQGKLYESDNPAYDEFFEGVHAVQKQTTDATEERRKRGRLRASARNTQRAAGSSGRSHERARTQGTRRFAASFSRDGLDTEEGKATVRKVTVTVRVPDEAAIASNQREVVKRARSDRSSRSRDCRQIRAGFVARAPSSRSPRSAAHHDQPRLSTRSDRTRSRVSRRVEGHSARRVRSRGQGAEFRALAFEGDGRSVS